MLVRLFMLKGHLDSVPSLRDALIYLVEQGDQVEVCAPLDGAFVAPDWQKHGLVFRRLPIRFGGSRFVRGMAQLRTLLAVRGLNVEPADIVVGVDAEGLALASLAAWNRPSRVVYMSLEVLCTSDCATLRNRLLKAIERRCHLQAATTIIQDDHRAALLMQENALTEMPKFLLPNASRGEATRRHSTYLQKKLNLQPTQKVILHAGSIADWTQSVALAKEAFTWPDDWVLVFQCRKRPQDPYGRQVLELADDHRVRVMSEPVLSDELDELVSSADVGIALYQRRENHVLLGKNLEVMGKSSGKIVQYLKAGLPVVATALPSLSHYIEGHRAGVCVRSPGEVRAALSAIFSAYDSYASNALRCFNQEFCLDTVLPELKTHLRSLHATSRHRES